MVTNEEMEQIAKDSRDFFVGFPRALIQVLWLPFYLVARVFR